MSEASRRFLLVAALLGLFPALARAGEAPPAPAEGKPPNLIAPLSEKIEISGEIRLRGEYRDLKDYTTAANIEQDGDFALLRTRLAIAAQVNDWLRGYAQFQDSRTFGEETTLTADMEGVDLHQGYLEARFEPVAGMPMTVRAGRQEFRLGSARLVAERPWSNVGQSFDGVRLAAKPAGWELDLLWAMVKESGGNTDDDRIFGGAHASCRLVEGHTFDAYAYARRCADGSFTGEDGRTGDLTDVTAGLRAKGALAGWDYEAEAALQLGKYAGDDVQAWMAVARAGYTFRTVPWKPRVGLEYDFASGDADPTDGDHGGFDDLFGTRHGVLGIADYTGRSNLHDFMAEVSVAPLKDVSVRAEFHHFRLAEEKDAWRTCSLGVMRRDTAGDGDPDLGSELNLVVAWKTGNFTLEAGCAEFFAGPYVKDTTGDDQDAFWCYLQATVKF